MIDLKDFIKATLKDLIEAVRETQTEYSDNSTVIINPLKESMAVRENQAFVSDGALPIERVQFDVAVVEAGSKEAGGGAKVKVFSVGADADGRVSSSSEATSRVKFSIPIVLPGTKAR